MDSSCVRQAPHDRASFVSGWVEFARASTHSTTRGCGCGAGVLQLRQNILGISVVWTRTRKGRCSLGWSSCEQPAPLCLRRKLPSSAALCRPAAVLRPTGANPAAAHQHSQCVGQPPHRQVFTRLYPTHSAGSLQRCAKHPFPPSVQSAKAARYSEWRDCL